MMKRAMILIVIVFYFFNVFPAGAQVIFETAALAPTSDGGSTIGPQLLGARFHLDNAADVTAIGGYMGGIVTDGTFFGAILSLEGSGSYPMGKPFNSSEVIASTLFTLPSGLQDHRFPLSTQLAPGDYALVFGSEQLGASGGVGRMPSIGMTNLPGTLNKMYWHPLNNSWNNLTLPHRFVVEGTIVPEPATLLLFSLGGLMLRRKLRR